MIKGFIFDMDGTVVDTTRNDYQAWQRALQERGAAMSFDEFLKVLGAKGEEIVKKHLTLNNEEIREFLKIKEDYFMELSDQTGLQAITGIEDFFKKIKSKSIPIALATGAGKTKLEYIFKKLEIEKYFDVVLTANDVNKGKPDPEIFLKAANKLNIDADEAIVVEDAANGVQAAINGGMYCLAITSTHDRQSLKHADLVIDAYEDFDWGILEELRSLKNKQV